jgi:molybdopterin-guanine dinucleotide biosynthesis adapter protein
MQTPTHVIGFAGWSGSGKTTLIEQLIPWFAAKGLRISVIKHAHHRFDVDVPGKDSYRHRQAGATQVLITSSRRWVLMHELRGDSEPTLQEQLSQLASCDLVLVEGFRQAGIAKIEVYRPALQEPLIAASDTHVVAVASDAPVNVNVPVLDLNNPPAVGYFILQHFKIAQ